MFSFFDSFFLFSTIIFHGIILGALDLPTTFASPINLQGYTLESLFRNEDYTTFQISGGVGGNALEEARLVFEDPFRDTPLVDVPYSIYERLLIMWEEVEYASLVGYPEALETAQRHADTTLERSLLVGETKNTVLMRMAQVQIFRIKLAKDGSQGKDTDETEEILSDFEEELMAAVEDDKRNRGRVSAPVPLVYTL